MLELKKYLSYFSSLTGREPGLVVVRYLENVSVGNYDS